MQEAVDKRSILWSSQVKSSPVGRTCNPGGSNFKPQKRDGKEQVNLRQIIPLKHAELKTDWSRFN